MTAVAGSWLHQTKRWTPTLGSRGRLEIEPGCRYQSWQRQLRTSCGSGAAVVEPAAVAAWEVAIVLEVTAGAAATGTCCCCR